MYIPVHLCAYVLKKKLVSEFRLYIYLKYKSGNGKIYIDKDIRIHIGKDLNLHEKTVAIQLKKLIELKWIGRDRNNNYHIRSKKLLYDRTSEYKPICYKTEVDFSFSYLNTFRAYLAGAVFGYFINNQKRKRFKKREGLENASSLQSPAFFPLALIAMNKILGIGISTLETYRLEAVREKYISFSGEKVECLLMPNYHINWMKKHIPEIGPKLISRENNTCMQRPNCYSTSLHFKRGRFHVT